jgi:predicted nucleic acid-binding protein
MKYLLDVNALIALCIAQHQFHSRVALWTNSQRGAKFLTSSITEIGFVRIAAHSDLHIGCSARQGNTRFREIEHAARPYRRCE